MGFPQAFRCKRRRKLAGIPDFKPVGKEHDLHAGVAGVVAMGHGVDDGLGYGLLGKFVSGRGLHALRPGTDVPVDFGKNEIRRLIHQFENRPLIDLVRRNGFADGGTVEVHAFDFRGRQKALRLLAEQQHGRMGRAAVVQQVEMGQGLLPCGFHRQGIIAFPPGNFQKGLDLFLWQIVQGCSGAGRGIKRQGAQVPALFHVLNEGCIQSSGQII